MLSTRPECRQAINACGGDRRTPLIQMAKKGHLPLVKLLLEYGADVYSYDQQAMNALMHACTENRYEIAKYLIENTVLNVNDYKVDTAIWYASAHGNTEIVQLLIEKGAKIEYRRDGTIYSSTPLMEACEWGHLNVVQVLLEYGAHPSNKTGRKALKLAEKAGYSQVVDVMHHWSRRLQGLDAFVEEKYEPSSRRNAGKGRQPPSLLPLVLAKTAKRSSLMFAILRTRGDVISYAREER